MLVSIVVCNFNYASFLDAALSSAAHQTHPDVELIVIDDGSTDDSLAVLDRWRERAKVIVQANQGQVAAYNRGFAESRGEVVIFLDADDTLDADLCALVVSAFTEGVAKVHYHMRLLATSGEPIGTVIPRALSDGDVSGLLLSGRPYASSPGSGNAYRRAALEQLMPIPDAPEDRYGADFFTVFGISLVGPVRSLGPEPHAGYRLHRPEASTQLLFGNAGLREPIKSKRRYQRLRTWVTVRLGETYRLPEEFIDFSSDKQVFAESIFSSDSYLDGLRAGSRYLASQLRVSILGRPASGLERAGLFAWAIAVLVLPRPVGLPLARYVCNPASRATL